MGPVTPKWLCPSHERSVPKPAEAAVGLRRAGCSVNSCSHVDMSSPLASQSKLLSPKRLEGRTHCSKFNSS